MLIGNLDEKAIVNIFVTDGTNVVNMDSEVIKLSKSDYALIDELAKKADIKSFIAMELITERDLPINFLNNNVLCCITSQKDGKPYTWKNVKIAKVKLHSGYIHIAFCNDDVDSFNRRTEFRLWLGYDTIFKVNENNAVHRGMIKDLSNHGGGFIFDDRHDIKLNDTIHIQFYDSVMNKIKNEYEQVSYSASYKVVRISQIKDKKLLIGCITEKDNNDIIKFLNRKQRERLKLGNKNALYKQERDSKLADCLKEEVDNE